MAQHSDAEAASNLKNLVSGIDGARKYLQEQISGNNADVILRRWQKKGVNQRKKLLLSAEPHMYASCDAEFEMHLRTLRCGVDAKHQRACLTPYLYPWRKARHHFLRYCITDARPNRRSG